MPFAEGESLRQRLTREQQLPLDAALHITEEVGPLCSMLTITVSFTGISSLTISC